MERLLKTRMAIMWGIKKVFLIQWHGRHGAWGGILVWGGVWDVSGQTHIAENITVTLYLFHQKVFVATKEAALAHFLFLFMSKSVSAEECKTCGGSSIVFINVPPTLEQLLGSNHWKTEWKFKIYSIPNFVFLLWPSTINIRRAKQ